MIFAQTSRAAPAILCALLFAACATPPRRTPEALALAANARATIEGRVMDRQGRPISAIKVQGLPRGKDAGWSPPAVTDSEGRFRLVLIAPAEYGFLLSWNGRTVITPQDSDPSRLRIAVLPGERREGIEIRFLQDAWEELP